MKLLNLYNLSILCLSFLIVGFFYVNKEGEKRKVLLKEIIPMKVTNPRLIENWMHQIKLENDRVKNKVKFGYEIDTIKKEGNDNVQPLFKYTMNCFLYNNSRDTIYYLSSSCDGIVDNIKGANYLSKRMICSVDKPIKARILPYEKLTFELNFFEENIDYTNEKFAPRYELIALPKSFEVEDRFRAIQDLKIKLYDKKEYLVL